VIKRERERVRVCVCVCVRTYETWLCSSRDGWCVCERERERESVCVRVCVCLLMKIDFVARLGMAGVCDCV